MGINDCDSATRQKSRANLDEPTVAVGGSLGFESESDEMVLECVRVTPSIKIIRLHIDIDS